MDLKFKETVTDGYGKDRRCHRLRIVPNCCESVQKSMAVILGFSVNDIYENPGQVNAKSQWQLRVAHQSEDFLFVGRVEDLPAPVVCPFCATPLPEPVPRKKKLGKVCSVKDGGYYCETCSLRLDSCTCWPPIAVWEVP